MEGVGAVDAALLLEYGWVLLVLIALEGILAADNALVIAIMVKHLPEKERKKALFYGLAGAFVFRFASLFIISFLVDVWQVQAVGAAYLLFISFNHIFKKFVLRKGHNKETGNKKQGSGLWMTVLKVELADLAFAVDAILAAVAFAVTLPETPLPSVGGLDGGQFGVILAGGIIGLVIMRYAASFFVGLLQRKPGIETAAFLIVGWVGVKLTVYTLSHPDLAYLPEGFPKTAGWKITFWSVLLLIGVLGWFLSKDKGDEASNPQSKGV